MYIFNKCCTQDGYIQFWNSTDLTKGSMVEPDSVFFFKSLPCLLLYTQALNVPTSKTGVNVITIYNYTEDIENYSEGH